MTKQEILKSKKVKVVAVAKPFVYEGVKYVPGGDPCEMYELEYKAIMENPHEAERLSIKLVNETKPVDNGK